jgi:UDP-N-acetylmuramyl pentapeptide synthase
MNIIRIFVQRPVLTTMITLTFVVLGVWSYGRMPVELMPSIEFPFVIVTTVYPGASPGEVESQITKKIEDAVATIANVKTLTSSSQENLSLVYIEFELETDVGATTVRLHAPGVHNVRNALAAAAAATAVGASLEAVARGLAAFRPVKGRMQPRPGRNGVVVIDDTYNANPDSVRAAIDVLAASERPRVLVLGDMGEVGAQGDAFHEEIGRYAKESGVDRLLAVGTLARTAARAFGAGGEHLDSIEAVIARAQGLTVLKGTILVKGSRFMRMERVVEHLLAPESSTCS